MARKSASVALAGMMCMGCMAWSHRRQDKVSGARAVGARACMHAMHCMGDLRRTPFLGCPRASIHLGTRVETPTRNELPLPQSRAASDEKTGLHSGTCAITCQGALRG